MLGRRLLTTNDIVQAATTVNQHWSSYVERTGLTAGNPEVGWWTDVQHEALRTKGYTRIKMTGKQRFKRMLGSTEKYIIKYQVGDHLSQHFIGVDCSSSPKLILDSESAQPIIFKDTTTLLNKIGKLSNLSRIYIIKKLDVLS